jgi:hypothetical protein
MAAQNLIRPEKIAYLAGLRVYARMSWLKARKAHRDVRVQLNSQLLGWIQVDIAVHADPAHGNGHVWVIRRQTGQNVAPRADQDVAAIPGNASEQYAADAIVQPRARRTANESQVVCKTVSHRYDAS